MIAAFAAVPQGLIQYGMALLQDPTDAVRETWRFLELPQLWIVVLVLVPGAFAIATLAYWKESLTPRMRWSLVALRFLSLMMLLLVLFRPVHVRQQQNVISPEVLLLFDDSGSMSREDAYAGDLDAQAAIEDLVGTKPATTPRTKIAAATRSTSSEEQVFSKRSLLVRCTRHTARSALTFTVRLSAASVTDVIRISSNPTQDHVT